MLGFNDFVKFLSDLKSVNGFKTTIKEERFNPIANYEKIKVTESCYNKLVKGNTNSKKLNHITNKHKLTYELQNDNTIIFIKAD